MPPAPSWDEDVVTADAQLGVTPLADRIELEIREQAGREKRMGEREHVVRSGRRHALNLFVREQPAGGQVPEEILMGYVDVSGGGVH